MIKTAQVNLQLLVRSMFQPALLPRANDDHKGSYGSVAIIGGDAGMVGAAILAARAALLTGAGRVYAALLSDNAPVVDLHFPEIMLRPSSTLITLSQLNAVIIGPGLGQRQIAIELLEFWLTQNVSMLLDADALNLIATNPYLQKLIRKRQAETVITPHPGEASRLLGLSTKHVQQNRTVCALELAKSLHVTCVLKGAGSVCAHYDGRLFINTSGNPGLASGGTGDVLSGVIGSLMAQGLSGLDAAKFGVFVHGDAADALVVRGVGPVGLTASDVTIEIRNVINQLNKVI
jgi:hydroxyethylthiazole kinase-like uncharacterized protein yjeF